MRKKHANASRNLKAIFWTRGARNRLSKRPGRLSSIRTRRRLTKCAHSRRRNPQTRKTKFKRRNNPPMYSYPNTAPFICFIINCFGPSVSAYSQLCGGRCVLGDEFQISCLSAPVDSTLLSKLGTRVEEAMSNKRSASEMTDYDLAAGTTVAFRLEIC